MVDATGEAPLSFGMRPLWLLVFGSSLVRPLAAQTDYRNLDDGRPVASEDAWPIEHRGLELLTPIGISRQGGVTSTLVTPELGWGVWRNAMIGIKLPLLLESEGGYAGTRAYAFYNFNAESPALPGFALRADLSLPGGAVAGEQVTVALKAIATRSWGKLRTHLNVLHGFGSGTALPSAEAAPHWGASLAGDLVSLRHSTLFLLEIRTAQATADDDFEWTTAAGVRTQVTPTLVLDAGMATSIGVAEGNALSFTLGLSHAFGWRALWPRSVR